MSTNYTPYSSLKKEDNMIQTSSRYQGRNELSLNRLQSYSSASRHTNIIPASKQMSILQQQQISDLERKIDLILMHNQKLQSQKQRYRLLVEQLTNNTDRVLQSNHTARFVSEENQIIINKLRKQLELSAKSYQIKLNEAYQSKQILKKQIQSLSRIIENLNSQNKLLKYQIKQKQLKEQSLIFKLKQQNIRQQTELENKLKDQFLIKQIQFKNQISSLKHNYQKQIAQLIQQFKQDKKLLQQKNNQQIHKLKEQQKKQQKSVVQHLKSQFQKQKQQIQQKNIQNIKKQKSKALQFIQQSLQNVQSNDQQIKKQYQQQIQSLKKSLESRKKLIQTLLQQNNNKNYQNEQQYQQNQQQNNSWFKQLITLKEQLKNVTNSFLRQSQLLKLKMSQKHQIDIKQLKKIYEDKIQIMSLQINGIQQQNHRLRDLYEQALNRKINLKKQFQLERSNLKNLIRKLKVQLNGIQQQFRINIQGVRDQNNTFSMTMMKSVVQIKDKANFYAQQNRKLRKAFDQHQRQLNQTKKLQQQKVQYYQSQYQSLKNRTNNMIAEFKQRIQTLQLQSQQRQNQLRQNLNRQHQMIQSLIQQLRQQNNKLNQQNDQIKRKKFLLQATVKQKQKDAEYFKSKVAQLDADIEKLKMDLEMNNIFDKDKTDTINQWKNHYQNIIKSMDQQKEILNQKLIQKDNQLTQIVKKYKTLQFQLQKVLKTFKKRSNLEKKVMQIGMDENIIKNLAEVFSRENQPNQHFVNIQIQ